jgi:hypothetical protein
MARKLIDMQITYIYIACNLLDGRINMKTQHLHDVWASPDNSRLTSKQFSFRFPVHIAAKIAALCEMYSQKNRTHIVADLLAAALDDLEKNLPMELGAGLPPDEEAAERMAAKHLGYEYEPSFEVWGPRAHFRNISNRFYQEMEKELGNENPLPLYQDLHITEKQFKESQSK